MGRCFQLFLMTAVFALTALANVILPPGIHDNIVVCQGNTCTSLTGGSVNGAASFSGDVNGGGTIYTINALADGTGGPGNLKALSSYTMSGPSSFYSQIQSNVEYSDNLTITSPSQATGMVGYLVATIQIKGSTTASGLGNAGILWQDSIGTAPVAYDPAANCPISPQPGGCYFTGNVTLTMDPIPFHFGDSIWLDFFLGAGTYPQPSLLSGTADYSHTAILTGMQVYDSTMNPISNPGFASAAGVQYSVNGAVPEPASVVLLGAGLLAIGAFRYRKRKVKPSSDLTCDPPSAAT